MFWCGPDNKHYQHLFTVVERTRGEKIWYKIQVLSENIMIQICPIIFILLVFWLNQQYTVAIPVRNSHLYAFNNRWGCSYREANTCPEFAAMFVMYLAKWQCSRLTAYQLSESLSAWLFALACHYYGMFLSGKIPSLIDGHTISVSEVKSASLW